MTDSCKTECKECGWEGTQSDEVCGLCLGVRTCSLECLAAVQEYDVVNVELIGVKLPPAVSFRATVKGKGVEFLSELKSSVRKRAQEELADKYNVKVVTGGESDPQKLQIEIILEHKAADDDALQAVSKWCAPVGGSRKTRKRTRSKTSTEERIITHSQLDSLKKAVESTSEGAMLIGTDPIKEQCKAHCKITRPALYVCGNYVKLARGLTQTPWSIDGSRRGSSSVEELIANPLMQVSYAAEEKFHSAGREDMDVRMLGDGRPFIVELLNAKLTPTESILAQVEAKINAEMEERVVVSQLRLGGKESMEWLLKGENSKKKQYTCVVWVSRTITKKDLAKLESVHDLEVTQNTPIRVLHRRSAMDRQKIIHSCTCELINQHFFILRLVASAGTYIKEFVHGDFGRTKPNVASILDAEADIIQLDVEQVILD